MQKFIDWIQSLPKAVAILLGVAVFGLFVYVIYRYTFVEQEKPQQETSGNVIIDFPDGNEDDYAVSKFEELRRSEGASKSVNEYWESLRAKDDNTDGGLKPAGGSDVRQDRSRGREEYLDPSVYSEIEMHYIRDGIRTKEQVDREHREREQMRAELEQSNANPRQNSDSVMLARMEKAYQIAQKYSKQSETASVQQDAQPPVPGSEPEVEPEPRRIELGGESSLRTTVLNQENIISSLDEPVNADTGDIIDALNIVPAKATFLKNETVVSGQKVIMRLLQDLKLSDGTVIPANTHVNGICSINSRLNINIKTISYNGKIYYTDIDVFDIDGTEGIYCPVIVTAGMEKAGKNAMKKVGRELINLAGDAASVINPYVGRISRSTAGQISQAVDSNGNVSVNINAGYEFYMFENVEDKRN